MLLQFLLVTHIAVLGYWLGAELVINATARRVALHTDVPFDERDRLWSHVLDTDQHVRYALILQAMLGTILASLYGFIPGGDVTAWGAAIVGGLWIAFIEITHRLRSTALGARLGLVDRWSRYVLAAALIALAIGLLGASWPMPFWLRLKMALFAGVILSGVSIRLAVMRHFRTWAVMARDGPDERGNREVATAYWLATLGVVSVWVFIFAIAVVSVLKPE